MKCKESKLTASAYLDGQVDRGQKLAYQAHLTACADCRSYLSQVEQVSGMMVALPCVEVPRELRGYVMNEVRRRTAGREDVPRRAIDVLIKLNPHLVSYSIGAVASIVLFGMTLLGFRPIVSIAPMAVEYINPIIGSDLEYHSYNDLPPDARVNSNEHAYELPRVGKDSSLVTFSNIAYQKPGDEGASALIEVSTDGKAKVVQVLQKPKDPDVMQDLKWSLSKRPFQPALLSGKPIQTRIVLITQKVDVSG